MCSRYPQHDTNGCSVPSAERNGSNPESSQDLTEHFGLLVDYLALTLSRNNRGMYSCFPPPSSSGVYRILQKAKEFAKEGFFMT